MLAMSRFKVHLPGLNVNNLWMSMNFILALLTMLGALDLNFVGHAYQSTITKGASVQLVFGFEYAILLTIIINIAIKYALHTIDLNSENPWDNKAVFLLYTELVMGESYTCHVTHCIQIYVEIHICIT
jgi:E3 ubiquitin-protein ligase synoviolin